MWGKSLYRNEIKVYSDKPRFDIMVWLMCLVLSDKAENSLNQPKVVSLVYFAGFR